MSAMLASLLASLRSSCSALCSSLRSSLPRPFHHAWWKPLRYRAQRVVIGHLPKRSLHLLAAFAWQTGRPFNTRLRAHGQSRAAIGRDVLGLAATHAREARCGTLLEQLIDRRIYFGRLLRGTEDWPDLHAVADALHVAITRLRTTHPDRPVIVSPFHYVSQYANICVVEQLAALLGLDALAVVSGVPRDQYGDDHAMIPGLRVLYTYGDEPRNGLGLRLARSLRRNGVAVLFADVPPFTLHRYPMETVGVTMHGRAARIHHGVFRLCAPLDAILLPFYLRFARGRFEGHLCEPLPLAAPDAPQRLADCIGRALLHNYPQWLPAGHPAMYSFATVK